MILKLLFLIIWVPISFVINLILFIPRLLLKLIAAPKMRLWGLTEKKKQSPVEVRVVK